SLRRRHRPPHRRDWLALAHRPGERLLRGRLAWRRAAGRKHEQGAATAANRLRAQLCAGDLHRRGTHSGLLRYSPLIGEAVGIEDYVELSAVERDSLRAADRRY